MMKHVSICTGPLLGLAAMLCSGCSYDVKVGKYEKHGPTITQNRDGSTTSTTGGSSFRVLEVTRQGDRTKP